MYTTIFKGLFSFFAVPILLGDVTLDFMSTIAVDVMVTASATGSGSGVTIMNTNTNMNTNNNGRKRRKRAEMLDSVINSCEYLNILHTYLILSLRFDPAQQCQSTDICYSR